MIKLEDSKPEPDQTIQYLLYVRYRGQSLSRAERTFQIFSTTTVADLKQLIIAEQVNRRKPHLSKDINVESLPPITIKRMSFEQNILMGGKTLKKSSLDNPPNDLLVHCIPSTVLNVYLQLPPDWKDSSRDRFKLLATEKDSEDMFESKTFKKIKIERDWTKKADSRLDKIENSYFLFWKIKVDCCATLCNK